MNLTELIKKHGKEGEFEAQPCSEPCEFPPGSDEKLQAMAARYQEGEDIHHADDATYENWHGGKRNGARLFDKKEKYRTQK